MAYKSLYRKYRPSKFEDVCGQKYIVSTLCNAISNNKISHAYLFCGTRGTGKTTIAKIFAKMVNCIDMKDNKPCGKCEICSCENTDEIPDIIEIDAASNNGVDEIRELKNRIKLMPVSCKYKIYIIDEVHMLSTGAFNALLKTLEEPPEHVIFILATTEPQKLPITIISRCQRFDFKRISSEDAVKRLRFIADAENINVSDDALLEIAKISDGAMRDAIGLLDQLSSYSDDITINDIYALKGSVSTDVLFKIVNLYMNQDTDELLNIIEELYIDGKNFNLLIEDMLNLFRNILISKRAKKYFDKINIQNKEDILKLSETTSIDFIENIIMKLENLSKEIKNSNYARILFETTLLSNISIDENKKVEKEVKIKEEKTNEKVEKKPIISEPIVKSSEPLKLDDEKNIEKKKIKKNKVIIDLSDKKVLINNTIAKANTESKKKIKKSFDNLDNYLLNKKYKNAASILKDSTIAACSPDHLLLTYKYSSMVDENDNEIVNIEDLVSEMTNVTYKVVAISEDEWKVERPHFLELKKQNKLEIIEEKTITKNSDEDIVIDEYSKIFGNDILEMEE